MLSDTLFEVNEILQLTLLHYAAEAPSKTYNEKVIDDMIQIIERIDRLRTKLNTPQVNFRMGISPN